MARNATSYGPYRVIERMAGSETVAVYRAERIGLGDFRRPVVLTVLHPHLSGAEAAKEFYDVAVTFGRAVSPRLVAVEDIGEDHGSLYRACSAQGARLASVVFAAIERGATISASTAVWIGAELAHAFELLLDVSGGTAAAACSIPRDVLVGADGSIALCPPAVGPFARSQQKRRYEAPESTSGGPVTARSHVYSLALYLWQLLTHPTTRGDLASVAAKPELPAELVDVLMTACSEDPVARPARPASLALRLLAAVPGAVERGRTELATLIADGPSELLGPASEPNVDSDQTTIMAHREGIVGPAPREKPFAAVPIQPARLVRVSAVVPPGPRLEIVGAEPVRKLGLDAEPGRWVVGRGRGVDLVVDDPDASREHFEVTRVPGGRCVVYDLGSKNGLRINGQSVEFHTLSPGDEIVAGRTRLRFHA